MTKSIIKWILLCLINTVAGLLNYPLAPIAVLFEKDGWLPKWLWWMQTPDNPLAAQVSDRIFPEHDTPFKRWVNNVAWLWRNSMYGLSIYVLGGHVQPKARYEVDGSESVGNRPLVEGRVFRKVTNPDGSIYWQWYYVKAWTPTMCIRINLGWKLWGVTNGDIAPQLVLSANPFMGYSR